jgi:hypothetical protein
MTAGIIRKAMRAQRVTLAALAALLLSPLACGDDEPFARAQRDGRIAMTLDEFRLDPQKVFSPTGRVRIVATNRGRLTHNIAIEEDDENLEPGVQPREYARSRTAHPGQTVVARATLRPGRYRLVCTLANHDNLGQYGVLIVREAG